MMNGRVPSTNNKGKRYLAIDGLRGLAALGVVLYHFYGSLKLELDSVLPAFLQFMFSYGFLGVPVFFVISGLVISLSIGSRVVDGKYVGSFALRRSIRLDFTYWASILLAMLLLLGKNWYLGANELIPSVGNVLAHMFYLQDLLEIEPKISVVYWTLCMEIQLYLFFILSIWAIQKICVRTALAYRMHLALLLGVGLYSIFIDAGLLDNPSSAIFISNWHYFLIGVLVSNILQSRSGASQIFLCWMLLEAAFLVFNEFKPYMLAGLICGLFVALVWYGGLINKCFKGRTFQYFGAISYTLYLVHPDIGWKVIALAKSRLFDSDSLSLFEGLSLMFLGLAVSIVAAHVLRVLVEKPSLRLAARFK